MSDDCRRCHKDKAVYEYASPTQEPTYVCVFCFAALIRENTKRVQFISFWSPRTDGVDEDIEAIHAFPMKTIPCVCFYGCWCEDEPCACEEKCSCKEEVDYQRWAP